MIRPQDGVRVDKDIQEKTGYYGGYKRLLMERFKQEKKQQGVKKVQYIRKDMVKEEFVSQNLMREKNQQVRQQLKGNRQGQHSKADPAVIRV